MGIKQIAAAMLVLAGGLTPQFASAADPSPTIARIQSRGKILCPSHNGSYRGFAEVDEKGRWSGFDVDLCRGVAAMLLGNKDAVDFIPLSWAQRFPSLQSGDIDVIIKLTDWTMARDTELNLQFSQSYFFGSTHFAVKKASGIKSVKQLDGATICVQAGTSTARRVAEYQTTLGIKYNIVQYEKMEDAQAAYEADRCDSYVGWGPSLAAFLVNTKLGTEGNVILPELLLMQQASIAMRQGDEKFVDAINWYLQALWIAEENGVTSENVDQMKAKPPNPTVSKLLGAEPGIGDRLGLSNDWAYKVIKQVGNYAELFDRNLGAKSVYKLPRLKNNLWQNDGMFYTLIIE